MDMTYISGRNFVSTTRGTKNEDGLWEVSITMREAVVYPNGFTRNESIEGFCRDKNFDFAHKTAMRDVLQQLQDMMYSRGFDSLIEAVDYERSLTDDGETKTNEATSTE